MYTRPYWVRWAAVEHATTSAPSIGDVARDLGSAVVDIASTGLPWCAHPVGFDPVTCPALGLPTAIGSVGALCDQDTYDFYWSGQAMYLHRPPLPKLQELPLLPIGEILVFTCQMTSLGDGGVNPNEVGRAIFSLFGVFGDDKKTAQIGDMPDALQFVKIFHPAHFEEFVWEHNGFHPRNHENA